jgi:hypothetical protein
MTMSVDWFDVAKSMTLPQFEGALARISERDTFGLYADRVNHAWIGPDGAVLFSGEGNPEVVWENNWPNWYDRYGSIDEIKRVMLESYG